MQTDGTLEHVRSALAHFCSRGNVCALYFLSAFTPLTLPEQLRTKFSSDLKPPFLPKICRSMQSTCVQRMHKMLVQKGSW